MHITDIYNQAAAEGRARFSVELLPPLKGDGPGRVFEALDPLRRIGRGGCGAALLEAGDLRLRGGLPQPRHQRDSRAQA